MANNESKTEAKSITSEKWQFLMLLLTGLFGIVYLFIENKKGEKKKEKKRAKKAAKEAAEDQKEAREERAAAREEARQERALRKVEMEARRAAAEATLRDADRKVEMCAPPRFKEDRDNMEG